MSFLFTIAIIIAIFSGMIFFLKSTKDFRGEIDGFEIDQESVIKAKKFFAKMAPKIMELLTTPIDYLKKFTSPEGRESFSIKEKMFTYAIAITMALSFVLNFYYVGAVIGIGFYVAVKFKLFSNETKTEKSKEAQEKTKSEPFEFSFSGITKKIEEYISSVINRIKDENGKLTIYEYAFLIMLITIPFNILEYIKQDIHLGWIALGFVLLLLLAVHLIELVTGYHFSNTGDLKMKNIKKVLKEHQEKVVTLEAELAEKDKKLAEMHEVIQFAMQKTKAKEMRSVLADVVKKD